MNKDKNQELEEILKELNRNIKGQSKQKKEQTAPLKQAKPELTKSKDKAQTKANEPVKSKANEPVKSKANEPVKSKANKPVQAQAKEPVKENRSSNQSYKKKKNAHKKKAKKRYADLVEVLHKDLDANKASYDEEIFNEESKPSNKENTKSVSKENISEIKAEEKSSKPIQEPPKRAESKEEIVTVEVPVEDKKVRFTRHKRPKMTKREKFTAVFGFVVTIFVIIGVFSTVMGTVKITKELVNSTKQKEEFSKFIFPLVIVDVPEFDTPTSLDNSAIISSAIWAFIIDDNDKSQYSKDSFGEMKVPDVDIEPYIRKLYGNDVKIEHQFVDDTSIQMLYDADNKCYLIESTPQFLPYTPRVDKITREKDIYTLDVSYILPDAMWNLDKSHEKAIIDKIMQYRLKKTNTGYQILSVKLIDVISHSTQPGSSTPEKIEEESSENSDGTSSRPAIS